MPLLGLLALLPLRADPPDQRGPAGCYVRFRVDRLPEGKAEMTITPVMKIHAAPWTRPGLKLTPEPVTAPGWTPWVDLRKLPGGGNGSLILAIPAGAKGLTRFSPYQDDASAVRDIDWSEPDGTKIIVTPDLKDVRTFRDQERRSYQKALAATGEQLFPLSRPPLFFSNAWGYTTGGAAEYMVKTFRLLGFNSVVTSEDAVKYETLYGWGSQGGQYGPPGFMPYDEDASREKYDTWYRDFFTTGKGKGTAPGLRIFQLADEPGEAKLDPAAGASGFRAWLAAQGVQPGLFGKPAWDEVPVFLGSPNTPEETRLYYWSRRYQNFLTPKMYALAAEAIRKAAPNPAVQSYVALSGHALYMPSKMPLDMFQLAQYPGLMPGISDWMTSGSWNWDSHQAVAFSVAPFNAGARRYDGRPPRSFPMMHAVYATPFRVYTQLANQCKLISYYNYGPEYEVTEGFWSNVDWMYGAIATIDNRAAQVDDILGPGLMRPSRVAMLYADPQEIWWPQGSFADKRAAFLALSHVYYQPELVTEAQVRDGALRHYDALYLLDQFVSRDVQDRIAEWTQNGGLLWACADAAVRDEYQEPYDLLARFGGVQRDFTAPPAAAVDIAPVEGEAAFGKHDVPLKGRSGETIRPGTFEWPDARIRARYTDDRPAWGEKAVGKGKLVYLGHRAGLVYSRRAGARGAFKWWPGGGQRELLFLPLQESSVARELTLSKPLIMTNAISTDAGTVVLLFNMDAAAATDVMVTLREPVKPRSVQTFDSFKLADLPYEYADGLVKILLRQIPGDGAMIVVRRTAPPADSRPAAMRRTAEQALASMDWQALSAGAWLAGFFPDWRLASNLLPLLKHEHWAVRRSAAEALGRLGYRPAAPAIRAALDRETDAHAMADELYALARLGHRDATALCEKYRQQVNPVIRTEAERAEVLLKAR
ncbi:MAG: HEAT repeat domain-containing protein [Armatimonadota bacterium]